MELKLLHIGKDFYGNGHRERKKGYLDDEDETIMVTSTLPLTAPEQMTRGTMWLLKDLDNENAFFETERNIFYQPRPYISKQSSHLKIF